MPENRADNIKLKQTSSSDILQRLVRRYLFKLERLKEEGCVTLFSSTVDRMIKLCHRIMMSSRENVCAMAFAPTVQNFNKNPTLASLGSDFQVFWNRVPERVINRVRE
jgi:hypothetical protein